MDHLHGCLASLGIRVRDKFTWMKEKHFCFTSSDVETVGYSFTHGGISLTSYHTRAENTRCDGPWYVVYHGI